MNIQHDTNPLVIAMIFSLLSFTSIPAISMAADPWEPRGLEAVWSHGHSGHPDFMNVRRQQYESQIPAKTTGDPWAPRGLEAVWSHGRSGHPDFMNVRRQQYESQIDASSSSAPKVGAIVNLYEQGRSGQSLADIMVSEH